MGYKKVSPYLQREKMVTQLKYSPTHVHLEKNIARMKVHFKHYMKT